MMDSMTTILKELLHISIVTSLMMVVIFIIRGAIGRRLPAKYSYYLWIILLVRLLFPFSISSMFSVENMVIEPIAYNQEEEKQVIHHSQSKEAITYGSLKAEIYTEPTRIDRVFHVLTYIWLFGIFAVIFLPIISYLTLKRALVKEETVDSKRIIKLSQDARRRLGIYPDIRIIYSYYLDAPALIGVFKPIIILPYDKKDCDDETLLNILLHELVHYKKRHLLLQWAFWGAKSIYWFHPLVWVAHEWMRLDAELTCDDEVINVIGDEERSTYGRILVDMAEQGTKSSYAINAAGLINKKSELKQRILRISYGKKSSKVLRLVTTVLMILMIPVFFTVQAVNKTEKADIIVSDVLNQDIKVHEHIALDFKSYTYDSKNEKLSVVVDFELDNDLYQLLSEPTSVDIYFSVGFPKSFDPVIRREKIRGYQQVKEMEGNKGSTEIEFQLKNYTSNSHGEPMLMFEGCHINMDITDMEIELSENDIPYRIRVDDFMEITYKNLDIDKNKNEVLLVYSIEPAVNVNTHVNEQFYLKDPSGMYLQQTSITGSIAERESIYNINYFSNLEDVDSIMINIMSYTVMVGVEQSMKMNDKLLAWRFEIDLDKDKEDE